jgi:hypothetical protein
MHVIDALAAGIPSAANGVARLYRRGTSTRATWYDSFEAETADSSGADLQLDSTGSVIAYVNELVQVQVYDDSGQLLRDFIAGDQAYAVEVISPAFTGTDYTTGQQAVSKPTTVGALFDLWLLSAGAIDWKGLYSGGAKDLQDIFGAVYGMFFNVKSPEYGAVGDGATNDAAAIQAAITAAMTVGGIVVFPPGVYNHSAEFTTSTGVSFFAVPGTVTLRCTTAGQSSLRMESALANGPDTPTVIHGFRFDSTVTNAATQLLIGPGSGDEIQVIDCRFCGSAFATGAGIAVGDTLNHRLVVRGCYFQAQAEDYCFVDASSVGTGSISLEGCEFRTPADAYDAAMVHSTDNALSVSDCRFRYQGTSGTSRGIRVANTSKPLQVSGCSFETLSGSSSNYGVEIIAGMRVRVDDDNYFTGVTRYYQAADTDIPDATRSYLAVQASLSVAIAADAHTLENYVEVQIIRSTSATPTTLAFPNLVAYYGQKLKVILWNNSGGNWATAAPLITFTGTVEVCASTTAAPNLLADRAAVGIFVAADHPTLGPRWDQLGGWDAIAIA